MAESYSVYMHVNKQNNKKYIGITSGKPEIRWKNGNGYKKQKRFYSAIKSYGWDNFLHLVMQEGLSKKQAESEEERLIALYKTNDGVHGYNIENGGVIHKLSEEQKNHLSEINTGKHASAETKRKISESHKKIGAPWLFGKTASAETREKMSKKRRGVRNPKARTVYQYDLSGSLVSIYLCMEDARKAIGVTSTSKISMCCNGKRGKAYGFMWSYELENKVPYERMWKGGVIHG